MFNVYTAYDTNKRVIARIRPRKVGNHYEITARTYNRLLRLRTVGGDAGVYAAAPFEILVRHPRWGFVATI